MQVYAQYRRGLIVSLAPDAPPTVLLLPRTGDRSPNRDLRSNRWAQGSVPCVPRRRLRPCYDWQDVPRPMLEGEIPPGVSIVSFEVDSLDELDLSFRAEPTVGALHHPISIVWLFYETEPNRTGRKPPICSFTLHITPTCPGLSPLRWLTNGNL